MAEKEPVIAWFDLKVKPLLGDAFKLKYIDSKCGDLGDLAGVQFDSAEKGGYIYFWSSGYVGYQLMDYINEIEIVEDVTEEVGGRTFDEVFKNILSVL